MKNVQEILDELKEKHQKVLAILQDTIDETEDLKVYFLCLIKGVIEDKKMALEADLRDIQGVFPYIWDTNGAVWITNDLKKKN